MKIPFDIKYRPQIESGEYKVVTRDGSPARIICWDAINKTKPNHCIIALVKEDPNSDDENSRWYNTEGFSAVGASRLFLIPEPELTEFEEMLYSIFDAYNGLKIDVRAAVDANAKALLAIAKKEICKGCTVGLDQYWKGREDARKEAEKSYTFQYPPYNPPCHYGGVCINPMKDCINCPRTGGDIGISTTSGTCKKD